METRQSHEISFSITNFPDKNYCRVKIIGRLTRDILSSILEQVMSHPEYKPGMNRFWDFLETDVSQMSPEDWRTYAKVVRSLESQPGKVRAVALVANDLEYGMIRLFQSVGNGILPTATYVTRSEEEAEAWITSTDPGPGKGVSGT